MAPSASPTTSVGAVLRANTAPTAEGRASASAMLGALIDVESPYAPPLTGELTDAALLDHQRLLSEVERRVTAASAALAAEIRHRSRPDLGHSGLAQRLGARTPELLVQRVTGATKARANSLVRVGSMLPSAPAAAERFPWLEAVAAGVAAGAVSLEAAEAIRAGLGAPTDEVPSDALALAASALVAMAGEVTVETLAVRAREERLALDLALVVEREAALRARRSLTLHRQADGMTRLVALLDPESAATITSIYDGITSPRRGGPRFVDADEAARADLTDDPRATEQIALDSFVQLMHLGALTDPTSLVGSRGPAVQVLVADSDLRARAGLGFIEGQTEPVSIASVERHICEAGSVPVHFDTDGQVMNLGREQRLFTARQRRALAARDGGCRFGDCERPPSWCEAHHIDHWKRDDGETNVDVGILLCKHHHMLLHNNGWEIERGGPGESASYWLVPPVDVDPEQKRIIMPVKSAAARRLMRPRVRAVRTTSEG